MIEADATRNRFSMSGRTMRSVQYRECGTGPVIFDAPVPVPGAGQVLLRVSAAGVCHSDIYTLSQPAGEVQLPLILGHEVAGVVDACGDGADPDLLGQSVVVYGAWGCGRCLRCSRGEENLCTGTRRSIGLDTPGGMADYMLVDNPRHLVPLGGVHPVQGASLTDAALTPYRAVKKSLPVLGPGSYAVVIGIGGLGHLAIQLLRTLSPATVIAVDRAADKLVFAAEAGAHHVLSADEYTTERILALTDGQGADGVFDFVASPTTTELDKSIAAVGGEITLVGLGSGRVPVGFGSTGREVTVRVASWGSLPDLHDVISLAASGRIRVSTETFGLEDAPRAFEKLSAGEIRGRAVLTMDAVPSH